LKVRKGIFKTERQAWVAVALYTVLLYSTLTVAFDLYVSVYDRVGKATVSQWMNLSLAGTGGLLTLIAVIWIRPKASGYLALLLIGLSVAYCVSHLPVPAKRFHFFQYAPLTVLVFDSLRFRCGDRGIYVCSMALVALVGLGDETIQWMLPDRHFGTLDLVINSTAGLLTLVFIGFVLGEEKYPFPRWTK
jgi:hypothetical protein